MSDIEIRTSGRAGRITLRRPEALNAVTLNMIREITAILPVWAEDEDVALVILDAEGDRAFSAGGDIAGIYAALQAGRYDEARQFWREEYPLNAAISHYPKPVVSFLQGFTMGGGVGLGCHCSHRVVGERSRIAMPECSIGLVPDVGGSLLLARAPGHLGEYLGCTGHRMTAADAIAAGFADLFIPEADWPDMIAGLEVSGDATQVEKAAAHPGDSVLLAMRENTDQHFSADTIGEIAASLRADRSGWAQSALARLEPNAPLAMAAAIELIRRARQQGTIEAALIEEYRFAHRVAAHGDFQEGIRAAIIDKDRAPKWAHDRLDGATRAEVNEMLSPLGTADIDLEGVS